MRQKDNLRLETEDWRLTNLQSPVSSLLKNQWLWLLAVLLLAILLRLPAYDWLRGKHDERVYTNHRYTRGRVRSLLQGGGFRIEHLSYANTWLFPLAVVKRLGERIFSPKEIESDLSLDTGIFNKIFQKILSSEAPFISRIGFPYGLSVIAVAVKE